MPIATIIGIPYDAKSSFARGPALAPTAIRTALRNPAGNSFSESLYDVLTPELLGDAGNVQVELDAYPLDAVQQAMENVLAS